MNDEYKESWNKLADRLAGVKVVKPETKVKSNTEYKRDQTQDEIVDGLVESLTKSIVKALAPSIEKAKHGVVEVKHRKPPRDLPPAGIRVVKEYYDPDLPKLYPEIED